MIKKIKSIKNFGVYSDYKWDHIERISDFKEKNVIYGWNYSGKTTISRIFSSLKNKVIHEKFKDSEFSIVNHDGKEFQNGNLKDFPYRVEVFNSEYVKANFKWDTSESLDSIAFDVGENVKLREELEKNNEKIVKINGSPETKGKKDPFSKAILEFDSFETKFTEEAKRIKQEFNSLIDFTKANFKTVKLKVEQDLKKHIIIDVNLLTALKKMSLAKNDKSRIEEFTLSLKLVDLHTEVSNLLKDVPRKSEIIEILEKDKNLYSWAKTGLALHEHKTECSFCGQAISFSRVEALMDYFNNASAKMRTKIEEKKKSIETEIKALSSINVPKSKNDLTDKCQDQFATTSASFQGLSRAYEAELKKLTADLERKENGNIFVAINASVVDSKTKENLEKWQEELNEILVEHNRAIENFSTEQTAAREKFKCHLVASFLEREKYKECERKKNRADKYIRIYSKIVAGIDRRNATILGQLKSVAAGKESLNQYIKTLLGREDVNIELTQDDKFSLKRGNHYADNLSEGEKTAISFAYFLVSLESLHKEKILKDTIVFIDDPISSLDANHIAHVYSLINSFFFRTEDSDDKKKVINCFKQLFISTHNFEFFSFLKDSTPLNKKPGCEYYFVRRINNKSSSLGPLPSSLRAKSEYICLFELIYEFQKDGCSLQDERYVLIPNALRRFFELYTLIKLPGTNSEIDYRLNKLMDGPHQLKVLHHFSHMTSFEKLTKHDELILLLPDAIKELFELLKKDNLHYQSLLEAINVKSEGAA